MARLTRADMEAALAFAAEVGTAAPQRDRIDGWMLERIAGLVGSDSLGYAEYDPSCGLLHDAEYPGPPWVPSEHVMELLRSENAFSNYAMRTARPHFSAQRLTDVVDMRVFQRTELYLALDDTPHAIQMRMPAAIGGHWTLELNRAGRNYTERDVLLVDALRPTLIGYEAYRVMAATLAELQAVSPASVPDRILSRRENEVLDLVAAGASNAEIAERLWISPATVKKHLENVYGKLAVRSRTAALAHTGRSLGSRGEARPAAD